jgi:hypothetical protein
MLEAIYKELRAAKGVSFRKLLSWTASGMDEEIKRPLIGHLLKPLLQMGHASLPPPPSAALHPLPATSRRRRVGVLTTRPMPPATKTTDGVRSFHLLPESSAAQQPETRCPVSRALGGGALSRHPTVVGAVCVY